MTQNRMMMSLLVILIGFSPYLSFGHISYEQVELVCPCPLKKDGKTLEKVTIHFPVGHTARVVIDVHKNDMEFFSELPYAFYGPEVISVFSSEELVGDYASVESDIDQNCIDLAVKYNADRSATVDTNRCTIRNIHKGHQKWDGPMPGPSK